MGNQVILSVPVKNISELKKLSFKEAVSQLDSHEIISVKNIDFGLFPQNKYNKSHSGFHVCSGAYHASDGASLYVDLENMFYFPQYGENLQAKPENYIKTFIQNYRKYYPNYSVCKKSKFKTNKIEKGDKYAVFGFLTDRYSDISDDDFHLALDCVKDMVTLGEGTHINASTYDHSHYKFCNLGNFTPLGLFDSDTFVIATLRGNAFYFSVFPKYQTIDVKQIQVTENDVNASYVKTDAYMNAIRKQIIQNLGYTVKPKK